MATTPSTNSRANLRDGCTVRAFVVGCAVCAFIGVLGPYNLVIRRGSYLFLDFAAPGAFGLFFFLILLNSVLKLGRRRWGLDPAELLVVMIMMLTGGSVVTMGYMAQIFSFMSAGRFFADASNEYARYILGNTPSWMLVNDDQAIRWFYEGLPAGETIPWGAWARPFIAWLPLILSVYWVMMSLMVIVRRQWAENERLVFPQAQLPMEMAGDPDDRGAFPPLLRNWLFWIGFAVPFLISALNGLHAYFETVPNVKLTTSIPTFRGAMWMALRLSFPWVGFTYLLNTDVGLSLWLFALLAFVQRGIFKIRGIKSEEFLGIYGVNDTPIMAHQGMGAFTVFVVMILWTGRRHLADVLRKAIRNDPAVDDSDEMMSYRGAVVGTLLGSAIIWIWMTLAGVPWWLGPAFVVVTMAIFFGLTRIVAQGGFPSVRPPSIAQPMLLSGIGSSAFGPSGIVALCYTYAWAADIRTFPMVATAHAAKISERIGRRRPLALAMWLGLVITIAVSFFATLSYTHTHGALGGKNWFFGPAQKWAFDFGVTKIRDLERVTGLDGETIGGALFTLQDPSTDPEASAAGDPVDGPVTLARPPAVVHVDGPIETLAIGGAATEIVAVETTEGDLVTSAGLRVGVVFEPGHPIFGADGVEVGAVALETPTIGDRPAVVEIEPAGADGAAALVARNAAVAFRFDPPVDRLTIRLRQEGATLAVGVNGESRQFVRLRADRTAIEEGRIDSTRPYRRGYLHKGIGAAVMALLILLRNRFYWWPVHPIGYVVGGIWIIQQVWISIFITWLIKVLVLKLGGARAYHRLVPLFLGVIVGQFAGAVIWVGIDTIFGKVDNAIFWF